MLYEFENEYNTTYTFPQPNMTVYSVVVNVTQYNFTVPYIVTVTNPNNAASVVNFTGMMNGSSYSAIGYNLSDVTSLFTVYNISTLTS
jgi:hypothetical protein